MSTKDLTDKQKRFCEEYLIDLNATAAYKRAGYQVKSDSVAASCASDLLRIPKVQAYVTELQNKRARRTRVTADRVIRELARIAFSDISEVMEFDAGIVRVKSSSTLPKRVTAAIASVTFTETPFGSKTTVRMHSKLTALQSLGEHLGIFKHDANQDGEPTTGVHWDRLTDGDESDDDTDG